MNTDNININSKPVVSACTSSTSALQDQGDGDNSTLPAIETDNSNDITLPDKDLLMMTDAEFKEIKKNLVVEEEKKTVTLTVIRTDTKLLDGTVETKRETSIGYTDNINKSDLNFNTIVMDVTKQLQDFAENGTDEVKLFPITNNSL